MLKIEVPGRRRHEDSWMISDLEKLNHMQTIINLFYDTHAFKCVIFFLNILGNIFTYHPT